MNGFAALDIHPHRRYVVDIGGRRSSRCRLHINFAPFMHLLDFTQNLGLTPFLTPMEKHDRYLKADWDIFCWFISLSSWRGAHHNEALTLVTVIWQWPNWSQPHFCNKVWSYAVTVMWCWSKWPEPYSCNALAVKRYGYLGVGKSPHLQSCNSQADLPFSLHGLPAPFRRRCPARSLWRSWPGIPCRRSFGSQSANRQWN